MSTQGTLLIVDDNPDNLSVLFEFLSQVGFNVLVAKDGRRGIQKVEYARPDLILLDIMMPEMDGFEVCKILKSRPDTWRIPIIFMTALVDSVDKVKGLELGAEDYITKPFQQEEVLARVNTHLRLSRLQHRLEEKNALLERRNQALEALSDAMREAKHAAEEADVAKGRFLANMSHELRTPMSTIIGYSDILQEEAGKLQGSQQLLDDLRRIGLAGRHLLELINDILDFSKIEAGRMELFLADFSVLAVIEEAVVNVQPLIDRNGNSLIVHCPEDIGNIHADQTKVRQILLNLLSNAAKFTEAGEITLTAYKTEGENGAQLVMQVSDTGTGMSTEQQQKIFEAFAQADASKHDGTGLGMTIARNLAELMGGRITLESETGKGTSFTVFLPVWVEEPKTAEEEHGDLSSMHEITKILKAEGKSKGTVLIIDDDAVSCAILQSFIRGQGYDSVVAHSGEEGLRKAKELHPDMITLDVVMPDMDGWSVLIQLKNDPDLTSVPVLMLSIQEEADAGYSLGASGYLVKPVQQDQLADILEKHRPRDDNEKKIEGTPLVLVVDDNKETRDVLERQLRKSEWRVAFAEHGRQALEIMQDSPPDLILSDLMMPEMDGFEFIEELRRHKNWEHIPVVVLTAKDLSAEERDRLKTCAARVFQKGSYNRKRLLNEVNRGLAQMSKQSAESQT